MSTKKSMQVVNPTLMYLSESPVKVQSLFLEKAKKMRSLTVKLGRQMIFVLVRHVRYLDNFHKWLGMNPSDPSVAYGAQMRDIRFNDQFKCPNVTTYD